MVTKRTNTRKSTTSIDPSTISVHDLPSIEGWDALEPSEQATVKAETISLDKALIAAGNARIVVGEHLFNIREVLDPKRMFTKFLTTLSFSRASAYRYIDTYTAAKTLLPEAVLKQAMLRGADHISVKKVEASPPPQTTNVVTINEYLDTISAPTPQEPQTDPALLKKECYNFVHTRFQRLPRAGRSRSAWLHSLLGMLLAELGVSSPQTIEPTAIPSDYRSSLGRPRKTA